MKFLKNVVFILFFSASVCFADSKKNQPAYLEIAPVINSINMVMIHDVISPPVAARYYAYSMLSAYKIISENNKGIPAAGTFIKNFPKNNSAAQDEAYTIAAIYSMLETAKIMLPSGYMIQDDQDNYIRLLKKNKIRQEVIDKAIAMAAKSSEEVISFSKSDNYSKLSAMLRYTPIKGDAFWYPTPPSYLDAVEPNWNRIRPLVIDSAAQFKPAPPVAFSKDSTSKFFKMAKEVYTTVKQADNGKILMASFWDCNPFAITTSGHMNIGFKKISPGGHWMNIAALAVKKANLSTDESVEVMTIEAITLMDGFIGCWDEKYRSSRVRPETYINRIIDINWKPYLQTPPFPEYTSGHAVVSNSSATILTYLLGDNFAYTDDTELPFGLGPRSFKSFKQAAAEASISRLYGGIHYRDSIEEGNRQGVAVATNVIEKIKKAGVKPIRQ
ncbi:phosphatase PAP2 family protein [Pedobacter sp. HMF7647]|uniref:Phosphatase PAP2 family protein n=1 Tax=Hufsiella arboris TaxID=2695275 RepID=A0A7K1YBW8_9SPHI|nr:vanadium-dependent haloperoxidase [Hufsiella arboris]MXV51861.1 phosphatase PAP2 family protein [Hufsiella arboris]